jgi:hypothetical protein
MIIINRILQLRTAINLTSRLYFDPLISNEHTNESFIVEVVHRKIKDTAKQLSRYAYP